jgi:paraquat-inducible protein B
VVESTSSQEELNMVVKKSRNGRSFFWMLKLVTAFAALIVMSMSVYAQSNAEGRVQITFIKAAGEGNGNLFFEGQKYGLSINGIKNCRFSDQKN